MIALKIILGILSGIVLLIAIILSLYIHLVYSYDGNVFRLYVRIGPVRINIFPHNKEKIRFRKLAKALRNKRIDKLKFINDKKKSKGESSNEKNEIDIWEMISDFRIDKMIEEIAKSTKNPEFTRILLIAAKVFVYDFKKNLHSKVQRIIITVDEKEAGDTCIRTGIISQALSYLLEFLNIFTVLDLPKEGCIAVLPCFDNSGYKFEIRGKFKIRIINILSALVRSAFKSITNDIEKSFN